MPADKITLPRGMALQLLANMRGWRAAADAVIADLAADGRPEGELGAGREAATALIRRRCPYGSGTDLTPALSRTDIP